MNEGMDRTEMEMAMKTIVANQEFLEASMKPLAELMYSKLKALVAAGFTREEALDVIKARGLNV